MRLSLHSVLLAFVHFTLANSLAQVTAEQAAKEVGKTVTVIDTIKSASTNSNQVLFLNFGAPFPNDTLSLIILPNLRNRFPKAHSLEGQTVQATGKIVLHNGYPRIILRDPSQLSLPSQPKK